MELDEFIKGTLVSIIKGVKDANVGLKTLYPDHGDTPFYMIESASWHKDRVKGYIDFDVAVKVSQETARDGSMGIKVVAISADGKVDYKDSDETVSRIKFGIAPNYTVS